MGFNYFPLLDGDVGMPEATHKPGEERTPALPLATPRHQAPERASRPHGPSPSRIPGLSLGNKNALPEVCPPFFKTACWSFLVRDDSKWGREGRCRGDVGESRRKGRNREGERGEAMPPAGPQRALELLVKGQSPNAASPQGTFLSA